MYPDCKVLRVVRLTRKAAYKCGPLTLIPCKVLQNKQCCLRDLSFALGKSEDFLLLLFRFASLQLMELQAWEMFGQSNVRFVFLFSVDAHHDVFAVDKNSLTPWSQS